MKCQICENELIGEVIERVDCLLPFNRDLINICDTCLGNLQKLIIPERKIFYYVRKKKSTSGAVE